MLNSRLQSLDTMEQAQDLARAFLQTEPFRVSQGGSTIRTHTLLRSCVLDLLDSERGETAECVIQAIVFRWSYMDLVDEVVEKLNLPKPSNKLCADWNRNAWMQDIGTRQEDWKERGSTYHDRLLEVGCCLYPSDQSQFGDTFPHPMVYLRAALVEGQYSPAQIDDLVPRIGAIVAKGAKRLGARALSPW